MELGGWKSYEMVLRYAHLAPDHLSHAAARIERVLEIVEPNSTKTLRFSRRQLTRMRKSLKDMARLARFERATAWFVARYSIQLSYRRVRGRTIRISA